MSINSIQTHTEHPHTLWLSAKGKAWGICTRHFDPRYLIDQQLVTDTATGRGKVYFFHPSLTHKEIVVLRHYYRGGLMAKLSRDKFLFKGLENTRSAKELFILDRLHKQGLNVPEPIAAHIVRRGASYTADIITSAIPKSVELHEHLMHSSVNQDSWHQIGKEIKKMHNAQVCHYDINVKNILLATQSASNIEYLNASLPQVFLLDFDKCEWKQGEHWKTANLARFKRSIKKQLSKHASYHFTEANWQACLSGYQEA